MQNLPLVCTVVKSKWKISQNFVAFSECMKFKECSSFQILIIFDITQSQLMYYKNVLLNLKWTDFNKNLVVFLDWVVKKVTIPNS